MENSVQLHRVFKTTPDKVYRAFTTADAFATWLPPYGFTCHVHSFEAKVGGQFKMSFTNFTTQDANGFGGEFVELTPNKKVKYTNTFDNPHLPGTMTVTILINEVICGTEIKISQENIPVQIPSIMCYLGWQESLTKLANLVEPNIPQ